METPRWVWPSCWLHRLVLCSWWSCHEQHMGWMINDHPNGELGDLLNWPWHTSVESPRIFGISHPAPLAGLERFWGRWLEYLSPTHAHTGWTPDSQKTNLDLAHTLNFFYHASWQCTIITKCVASIFDHREKDAFPARWDYRRAYQCCWLYHTHLLVGSRNCPVCLEELLLKARSETIKHQKGQDESIAPTWA